MLALLAEARAAHASRLESKEKAARKACISGDYAKGIAILSDLYVNTEDITYIFNQGRCFQQNGRYEEAILRFREYTRKAKAEGKPQDAEVDQHIADCEALLGKGATAPASATPVTAPQVPSPPPPSPVPATAVEPAAPAAKPEEPKRVAPAIAAQPDISQAAQPSERSGAGLRIAGIATFGVGLAAVATGVILNVKANKLAYDMEASTTSYRRSKEDTRRTYETLGWVAYSAGAACVVGSAVLYYLGYREGRGRQVAFSPMATAGGVAVIAQGAF